MTRTSRTTPTGLAIRGLAAFSGGLVAVGVVVMIVTAALTAWPRVTNGLLTTDLAYTVDHAGASTRDLQATLTGITQPNFANYDFTTQTITPVWKAMPAALAKDRRKMPANLRTVAGAGDFVGRADGPRIGPNNPAGILGTGTATAPRASSYYYFSVEANPSLRADAVLESGKWPKAAKTLPSTAAWQVVLSSDSAKAIGWKVGQTQTFGLASGLEQTAVLVGTVRPRDSSTDYWQLDRTRSHPGVTVSPDYSHTTYRSIAFVSASTWPSIALDVGRPSILAWYPIDGSRFDVNKLDVVESELQHYLASPLVVGSGQPTQYLRLTTQLAGTLNTFVGTAGPINTLLTIFATGPLGTSLAVLVLGVRLLVVRRQSALMLMWARGASTVRLRLRLALETAVASVPAAILGGVLGIILTPGDIGLATVALITACALAPPVVIAAVAGSALGDPSAPQGRTGRSVWIVEVLAVALAALSVVVLLQRGLTPPESAFAPDPLLTLTPLLVAFAACVIVLRAYPFPLRWIGSLLRRGRGVTDFIGWATSMRRRAGTLWPVFAVVTGVSITIFSLSVLTTERAGVQNAALSAVGADVSVKAPAITPAQVARMRATSGVERLTTVDFVGVYALNDSRDSVSLYLVDAAGINRAQAALPESQRALARLRPGKPLSGLIGGLDARAPTPVGLTVDRTSLSVRTKTVAAPPGEFITNGSWMVLDRASAPAELRALATTSSVLVTLKPRADPASVGKALGRIAGSNAVVNSAPAQIASVRASPLLAGVENVTIAALLLSALMCAAALVLTLVMNAASRIRLVGTLRTLGFSRRQSMRLIGWELGPIVVAGLIAGTLVGVVLPVILLTSVSLASVTGATRRPPLVVDPVTLVGTIAAFALAAVAATLIAIALARRASLATILRTGGRE